MARLDYFTYTTDRPPGGKVNDGKSVRVTVPAGASVQAGELVYLDGWFGLAMADVAAAAGGSGEPVALSIEDCVVSTSKLDELVTFTALDSCYWVEGNSSWSETLVIVTSDHETGYLTGSSGIYNEVVNNGKGVMPTMVWNSQSHTNQLVPIFAKGPGSDLFRKYAVGSDPVRGAYINNTDIPRVIRELLK